MATQPATSAQPAVSKTASAKQGTDGDRKSHLSQSVVASPTVFKGLPMPITRQAADVEELPDSAGGEAAFGLGQAFGNTDSAGTVATGITGACCLAAPCACLANQTFVACDTAGGVYHGDKSVCANDICGCLTRACCDPAGSCIGDQTRVACEGAGNTWHIEASCLGTNPSLPMPMCNIYNVNNCSWDNGQPLNDGGSSRSHTHIGGRSGNPPYDFNTADDFMLRGPDSAPCIVGSIRWWFSARPSDTAGPIFTPADPPNDFVGMNVTIFASFVSPMTGLDSPAGHGNVPANEQDLNPKVADAPLGVVYARTFFNNEGFITYTNLTGPAFCDPPPAIGLEAGYVWQADIAIDPPILLSKNTRYWLDVQGLFPFNDGLRETLQTWWMPSQTNTGLRGMTQRTGNTDYSIGGQVVWVPNETDLVPGGSPPQRGNQGAAAPCAALPLRTRFDFPFQLNGAKDSPGIPNDQCADVFDEPQNAFDGYNPFDNTGAGTDGPGSCAINQDLWFRYTATCDGMLTAELCDSTFASAVAIYDNVGCPVGGDELDCDSTSCGDNGSSVAVVAETADLLIRVGGDGAAAGSGVLRILCEAICGIDDGNTAVNNCCADHSSLAPPDNLGCEIAACCQIVCSTPGEEVCCNNFAIGWDSECATVAAENRACQCPCALTCPGSAQIEAEACGANSNGGCNSTPEVFESLGTLTLGKPKSLCGTVEAAGGTRDTDWFTVAVPSTASGLATLSIVLNGNAPVSVLVLGRHEPADTGAGETFCLDKVCTGATTCEAASACSDFNDCPPGQDCDSVGATLLLFDSIATAGCLPTIGSGNSCALVPCVPHNATYVVVVVPTAANADCSVGDGIFNGVTCGDQDAYSMTITVSNDCLDGACCMFDGGCEDGTPGTARNEYECFLANGTFAGEGTTCEALPPDVDCANVAHGCTAATIISCGETLMVDLTSDDHLPEEPYPCGAEGHDPNDRAWLRFRAPCVDDNDLPGVVCPGPGVVCPPVGVCPGPPGTPCFPGEFCDFCPADGLSCVVGTVCSGDDCDDQTGPDTTSVRLNTCDSINPGRDSLLGIYGNCCPMSGVCPSGSACDEGTFCGGACSPESPFAASGCSDDACGFTDFLGDICDQNLIEGETYYIQISNWAEPVNGLYTLNLVCPCTGACCDGASATCADDVPADECPAPMEFSTDETCAEFTPICGLGACCNSNGTCTDATSPDCAAPGDNHFLGTFCSTIVCNSENSCDFNTGDPTSNLDQANFGLRSQFAQDIDFFVEVADQFTLKGSPGNSCAIDSILILTFHTSHDTVNGCMPSGGAGCADAPTDYDGLIVTISNDLAGAATGPSCPPICTESSCTAGPDGDFHDDEGTTGCRSFKFGPALPEGEPIPSGNYWTYVTEGGGQPQYLLSLHFQPPIDLDKNQEKWLAITAIMREIAGYSVIWFASNNYNGKPIQIFSTAGNLMFEPFDVTPNDMLFDMQGVKITDDSCGHCRLHGDVAELPSVACLIDVDDLLCMLDGFANFNLCPRADIVPCAPDPCTMDSHCAASQTGPVCLNGACRCAGDADCAALGVLCAEHRQGGRCELVDVDDILSELDAFAGIYACPPPCPPGACVGDFIDDGSGNPTCRDGDSLGSFFVGNGMSETDCFTLTNGMGTYCGDGTVCDPDATCPGSP